jgi:hypothetical protein
MKNKLTFITLVVFALLLTSFKTKFYGYQIECVTLNSDNYIELKIWNENYKLKYKESQAQKEAIHSILYAGITSGANNCGTQPPILKNENDKQNFKKIEKKFFSKNGVWARFVKSSKLNNEASISLNKIYQIQVSKLELTKYLIEQKIIKSLNNGF